MGCLMGVKYVNSLQGKLMTPNWRTDKSGKIQRFGSFSRVLETKRLLNLVTLKPCYEHIVSDGYCLKVNILGINQHLEVVNNWCLLYFRVWNIHQGKCLGEKI